jgi:NAD(P)H-dependent FMN reductase|tara:strand:- start:4591 stop:5220 length:630 start_codon:yes stop_codon:yes gene_type:complete
MNKIVGISYSYADNSLQTRGLTLLSETLSMSVYDMLDFNMPICNSNKSDGVVPDSVNKFISILEEADILVFAISEATGHYSAGFKNAMDWLVVKSQFNAKLGTNYAITDKPIFVITFTPTKYEPNGARHFDMTSQLLVKLGANVIDTYVINDSWKTIIPGVTDAVQRPCTGIKEFCDTYSPSSKLPVAVADNSPQWLTAYNEWDEKWKE